MPSAEIAASTWSREAVEGLFELPFADLLHRAHSVHREHFDPNEVQVSTLLSIKTGGCPEDCSYCPQSIHYNTGLEREKLLDEDAVLTAARRAKAAGATRFCMGAAWRRPTDRNVEKVARLVQAVKDEGLETCVTLGMLEAHQAERLRESGLDYYNHNVDTSPDYYPEVISTRTFQDRLNTLANVRTAGVKVCCGGIIGMGETRADRAAMLAELANLPEPPESVPINQLVQVPGTPFHGLDPVDPLEFVRSIAVARILMPRARVRLSAGREEMSDETQALCFFAGANSIFYGDRLLTTENPASEADRALFERLGLRFAEADAGVGAPEACAT